MHTLMIKTHNVSKIKYLCYTTQTGRSFERYNGSGTLWKHHLKKYGKDVTTVILLQTEDYNELKEQAVLLSEQLNVVKSVEWANLKPEEGQGGSSTAGRKWVTDGVNDLYLMPGEEKPVNWEWGRTRCVFNNSDKQREFSNRVNRKTPEWKEIRLAAAKKMILTRDHSKCGRKGEDSPTKRPEVRAKMSQTRLINCAVPVICDICGATAKGLGGLAVHKHRSKTCKEIYANIN